MSDQETPIAGATPPPATPPTPPQPLTGNSPFLRRALAVSVAINLAVIGLGIGVAVTGGPEGHGGMVRDLGFGTFDEALRPEDRAALRAGLQAHAGDFRATRQQMQTDMATIIAALRATPFDPNALTKAMVAQGDHLTARLSLGRDLMADFMVALPAQDRLDFADRLESRLRHAHDPDPAKDKSDND